MNNLSTPNHYPISYSYQQLMSPYYKAAAQATPYWYSFHLFLSPTPSYSYQLLLSATHNWQSSLLLYQLLLQTSHFSYRVTLSHTPISYSHQPFLPGAFISYSYLLYLHTSIRYSYQNSFSSNHYPLLVSHTPIRYPHVTLKLRNNKILLQIKFAAFASIRKKIICTFRNVISVQIILRNIIPRNDDFFKVVST